MQYLFVNGRWIRDRSLGHAIQEAYRGLLMTGRYAVAFLFLDLPPEQVDVNVHPTKSEVRFRDSQALHHLVFSTDPAASAGREPHGAPASALNDAANGIARHPAVSGCSVRPSSPQAASPFDPAPWRSHRRQTANVARLCPSPPLRTIPGSPPMASTQATSATPPAALGNHAIKDHSTLRFLSRRRDG